MSLVDLEPDVTILVLLSSKTRGVDNLDQYTQFHISPQFVRTIEMSAGRKINATTLWPDRFASSPRPDERLIQTESPRNLMSSSSSCCDDDDQSSGICETPTVLSNMKVPRRGFHTEPARRSFDSNYSARSNYSAPKVLRINIGSNLSIPQLNLSSTSAGGAAASPPLPSSSVHTPVVKARPPEPTSSAFDKLKVEHGRILRLVAMEKLKTVMRVSFHRSTVGAAFSTLKSNVHLTRDLDTRERLESIIDQRESEMLEWENELDRLRLDNELRCQEIERLSKGREQELCDKVAELETRLKVYEDDLKHEQSEKQNVIRLQQRERLTEMRELSRRMKARVLTVRRKFRLLNYCMSTWYHARLKIWQRNELGRVHRELQTAKHEYTLAAHEASNFRKDLIEARMESEEIKNAVWSVWTNQVSYNDRRLKKLMRGLTRLVDGLAPDMQHGSKSFFDTLMRHYRNTHATQGGTQEGASRGASTHANTHGVSHAPPTISVA